MEEEWFTKVNKLLQKLIILTYLPVNLVNDPIIQETTDHKIPSTPTINNKIHKTYEKCSESVKQYLQNQQFLCLVLDE
jgi:hypothetical protein